MAGYLRSRKINASATSELCRQSILLEWQKALVHHIDWIPMDSRKKSIARMTSIFVVVEAVFVYYASGIFLFSTSPKMLFTYLPGYGYVIKTFFYYFWYGVYHPVGTGGKLIVSSLQSKAFIELPAAEHFTVALFYGIIGVAVMAAVVYSIKLKVTLTVSPKSPSSSL